MNGTMKNAITGIYMMLAVMLVSITRRLPGTKRLSTGITTLVLVAVVMLVAAGGASAADCNTAANPTCACGDTVRGIAGGGLSNTYVLPANLGACAGWGLKIVDDGVIIDGNGKTITGTASGCTAGMWGGNPANQANPAMNSGVLFDDVNNCVLKDLEIKDFCTGVVIGLGDNNKVENCEIHDNGGVAGSTHGVHLAKTHHNTITKNDIYDNVGFYSATNKKICGSGGSGNGIFLFGGDEPAWGDWNKFTHNNLTNNTKAGYFSKLKCAHNEISYNNATENGLAGIVLRAMSTMNASVHHNNASNNCGVGIYIRGNQSKIRNNTVCYNMNCSDFYPGGAIGCGGTCADCGVVSASQIAGTGGCGVKVESGPGTNYLYDNTICYNEDWDIYDDTDPADQAKLKGDDNKCNVAFQYKETAAGVLFPCDHRCDGWSVDLIVLNKYEVWVDPNNPTQYYIHYTVANAGTTTSMAGTAGIYINGVLVDTPVVPALNGGSTQTFTSGPHAIGTPGSIHKIAVCADIGNTETSENENNNCRKNIFGGPDLKVDFLMTNWNAGDASLKNFSVNYKIKNIGDITASNVNVKFCFCYPSHTKICNCITVPIGNLNADASYSGTVGQYKLPDPMSSYIKCMVDCPDAITENSEHNNFQHVQHPSACYHACGPCASGPGGCGECLDGGCGDVDCNNAVNMNDYDALFDYVSPPNTPPNCKWAGDVDCMGAASMSDCDALFDYVSPPNIPLPGCCPGGCP